MRSTMTAMPGQQQLHLPSSDLCLLLLTHVPHCGGACLRCAFFAHDEQYTGISVFLCRDNICHTVVAPAPDVPQSVRDRATEVAELAIGSLAGAGVFGVELFLLPNGEVLS